MKRFLALALAIFTLLALFGCGSDGKQSNKDNGDGGSGTATTTTPPSSGTTDSSDDGTQKPDDTDDEETKVFKTYLRYNGDPFTSTGTTPITVTWSDGIFFYDSDVNSSGVASISGLDGDYSVTLSNLPEGYTYNPNIYVATNDNPEITIEIYKLGTTTGSGTGLYSRKVLSSTSMYRATLKSDSHKIYFEFKPKSSGTYTIESWVSTFDDKINPKIDVYTSSFAAPMYLYTLDTGGTEGDKYTKNFKYEVEIAEEMISSGGQVVFIFAVYTTARNDKYYPVNVDFAVQYEGGFELDHANSEYVVPEELYGKMAELLKEMKSMTHDEFMEKYGDGMMQDEYENAYNDLQNMSNVDLEDGLTVNIFLNKHSVLRGHAENYLRSYLNGYYEDIEGKTWQTPATTINGRVVFIGTNYRYNEKTGFYHKYDESAYASDPYGYGVGYGPILYADISTATRTQVLDTSFTTVEYIGNKALTVSNGTENYKFFIESYASAQAMSNQVYGGYIECSADYENLLGYASVANSDGAVPVNEEVRQFLQKYAVNQVLFMDGDGWAETGTPPYESTENDQWLFACGYYE